MKKVLFSLIALMAVMTVQAQSICGSWQLMQPLVQNEGDGYVMMTYIHTFNNDGTFYSDADVTYSSEPAKTKAREVALSGTVKGTYTLEGDQLKMYPNINTFNLEIVNLSENGKVLKDRDALEAANKALNQTAKVEMAKQWTDDTYTVKLTANDQMLELTGEDGEVDRLMRIATIKH